MSSPAAGEPGGQSAEEPAGQRAGRPARAPETPAVEMRAVGTPAIGTSAPDFSLRDQHGRQVSLSDFRGRSAVILVFYPFAFSGICTGEFCEIRDNLGAFASVGVQVLACSVDHMFTQRAFADAQGLDFPMLSDFWPHGAVAQAYGCFSDKAGVALRGTFVVDVQGIVCWSVLHGIGQARDFGAYRSAVAALVTA